MKNSKAPLYKLSLVGMAALLSLSFTNCSPAGFEVTDEIGIGGSTTTGSSELSTSLEADPLNKYAWHLQNLGQRVFASKSNVAGFDLNFITTLEAGYTGNGIKVVVSDDGVERTHEDLSANIYLNASYDFTQSGAPMVEHAGPSNSKDMHATSVAGLIAAVAGNSIGSRGVASEAKIISFNFLADTALTTSSFTLKQLTGGHDVYNMSWGYGQNNLVVPMSGWEDQLAAGTTSGRSGKGSIYVKSSGNDHVVGCSSNTSKACIGSSVFDGENNNPYLIITGAMNGIGSPSSYSSRGSNVWVSSFGGEFGDDYPAMVTTDRTGCVLGYSKTSATTNSFESGASSENVGCNYTTTFNGTSSAAPIASGAIALLLEANPSLSWRDVKYVLAKSARVINRVNISHPLSLGLPGSMVFDYGNQTNAAGFKYNNATGFGLIDVDAAVALARNGYVSKVAGTFKSVQSSASPAVAIPDNSATGATGEITLSANMQIEAVSVALNITHEKIGQLAIDLISPSNTVSRLVVPRNSLDGFSDYIGEVFLTNAFYMESSAGIWKLRVYDAASGVSGTLNSWTIKVYGQDK